MILYMLEYKLCLQYFPQVLLMCLQHLSKKDESIDEIQQDFQESTKELDALHGTLKMVMEDRDLSWQEVK